MMNASGSCSPRSAFPTPGGNAGTHSAEFLTRIAVRLRLSGESRNGPTSPFLASVSKREHDRAGGSADPGKDSDHHRQPAAGSQIISAALRLPSLPARIFRKVVDHERDRATAISFQAGRMSCFC